jgi:hypothetical protein
MTKSIAFAAMFLVALVHGAPLQAAGGCELLYVAKDLNYAKDLLEKRSVPFQEIELANSNTTTKLLKLDPAQNNVFGRFATEHEVQLAVMETNASEAAYESKSETIFLSRQALAEGKPTRFEFHELAHHKTNQLEKRGVDSTDHGSIDLSKASSDLGEAKTLREEGYEHFHFSERSAYEAEIAVLKAEHAQLSGQKASASLVDLRAATAKLERISKSSEALVGKILERWLANDGSVKIEFEFFKVQTPESSLNDIGVEGRVTCEGVKVTIPLFGSAIKSIHQRSTEAASAQAATRELANMLAARLEALSKKNIIMK